MNKQSALDRVTGSGLSRRGYFRYRRARMRVTIAQKLALAVIAMVVLSVGAMAWITSKNLERGFIAYLNELQAKHLDQVHDILSEQYREHGDFEWLRANPRALADMIANQNGSAYSELNDAPPREDYLPPLEGDRRPSPADPFRFGPRLSLRDSKGRPIIGPRNPGTGLLRTIEVDGRIVGTLTLVPLRQIPTAGASGFVRGQIRDILWLAACLILLSALVAAWLARRLLRPVAALRVVTEKIAQGKLDARAPIFGRDELADLAAHVNAMAQSLEVNEQQRRKMLADVSHELRTPLTVIRGEIEALLDGIRQADSPALESLQVEVLRLNKLVDDLHQLALADAGDLHYGRQHIDLGHVVNQVAGRFKLRADAAGLRLLTTLPAQVICVHADSGRLTQVVTNLLENSVRYTDAGGNIALSLRMDGKHAELSIEDSAPGVPDGVHARLFERLYRVDQARGGSGLGLSICRSLIEAHRGKIVAMPSTLGGLKLLIRLPLSNPEEK